MGHYEVRGVDKELFYGGSEVGPCASLNHTRGGEGRGEVRGGEGRYVSMV